MTTTTTSTSLLIAGCGDIGCRLAVQMLAANWTLYGLRRSISQLPTGVRPIAGDLHNATRPLAWPDGSLDYLVYCVAAMEGNEADYRLSYVDGLRNVLRWLDQENQVPKRVFFVSSTSVYGQNDGEWTDEDSVTAPESFSGQIMCEAEQTLLSSELPTTVVRLAGIYGPGREWLLNQVRKGFRVNSNPPLYANRIHADDAAGLLAFLLLADAQGTPLQTCYLGVDNAPVPLHEVVAWLHDYLKITSWTESTVRRSGSKRCSNARARSLGWTPQYSNYREGYAAVLGSK